MYREIMLSNKSIFQISTLICLNSISICNLIIDLPTCTNLNSREPHYALKCRLVADLMVPTYILCLRMFEFVQFVFRDCPKISCGFLQWRGAFNQRKRQRICISLHSFQIGSGTHPVSYPKSTLGGGTLSPLVKRQVGCICLPISI
jgi:hypothetical protein